MSGSPRVRVRSAPHIGARVPGWVLRVLVGIVGISLCISQLPVDVGGFWLWVGIVVTIVAVLAPATPAAWVLMVMLGISLLTCDPSPVDARIYILIAGIHLLQLFASYARVVPLRSWIQLRSLAAPLRRYVLVQVPVQCAAVVTLIAFAPRTGEHPVEVPALGIVAGVALILLTLILIVTLILPKRPDVR